MLTPLLKATEQACFYHARVFMLELVFTVL